jgi:DNA-binding response OmpR family regulator
MPTVIVADDEHPIRLILSQKLRAAGFEVRECRDGSEAAEEALRSPPDLVVTDFQMPEMSGLEMSKRLKAEPTTSGIPVLMLTARGHIIDKSELAQTNIRWVLSKPFSARQVLECVQTMFAIRQGKDAA